VVSSWVPARDISVTTMPMSTPWDGSKMPSQAGKIAIVTGANSGIGYFTARALAEHGAFVVLACRSESRGLAAEQEMTAYLEQLKNSKNNGDATGSVEFVQVDMSNLASVRAFAEKLRRHPAFTQVNLLINNAGVLAPPLPLTTDGLETQFGVNYVSHFLLTKLLFDLLKAAPAARVVSISSLTHHDVPSLEFDTLVKGTDQPWARYAKSKLANLLFSYELGRRLETAKISNVIAVAAHPGTTYTPLGDKMVESQLPKFMWSLAKWILKLAPLQSSEMGALPTLYAATVENVANGDYYGPLDGRRGYPVKEVSGPQSHNRDEATRLWTLSEELTGDIFAV
jgi:NAD(P)-dependent dehydrogenase (short-subunit alcohol dehydrogenase family)